MKPSRGWIIVLLLFLAAACSLYWQAAQAAQQRRINRSLYAAVEAGDTNRVQYLLKRGANPDVRETPIPEWHGFIQYLKHAFAHQEIRESGSTALMSAA